MDMLILLGAMLLFGLGVTYKVRHQRQLDSNNASFTLTFPAELDPKLVLGWLQSVSGALHSGPNHLGGYRTLTLETVVTGSGMEYRLRAPWQQAHDIAAQLQGLVPGIRCEITKSRIRSDWTVATEWGESNPERTLRIPDASITASTLIGTFQPLKDGEELIYQWVLTPSREKHVPPHEKKEYAGAISKAVFASFERPKEHVDEHRAKLAEINFDAILRVAAYARSRARARYLVGRVAGALRSVKGQNNILRQRVVLDTGLANQRVSRAAGPLMWPAKLTVTELSALIAWPLGAMDIPGLPVGRTRHMSANNAIPREGIVIGNSTLPGKRPVALTQKGLMTHAWIAGATGLGKSTLLENIGVQLMQEGAGMLLIEPSGDLARKLLDIVPSNRLNDVIYLDPTDTDKPVGLNLMQGATPSMVTSYVSGVLEAAFGSGIQTSDILRNTIYTVALQPDLTLYEVALILDDAEFRDDLTRGIQDEQLQRFWTRYEGLSKGEQAQTTEPVMRRLRALLVPELKGIFGQSTGLDMKQVLAEGKIVIVNLAEGQIGESNAELLGSLVVARLWQEVQARSLLPEEQRTPFFLIADEFQRYVKLPTSFSEILAQARKYGLGCLLAHQHLGQIGSLRDDVLTNAITKVVLGSAAKDAATIAKELGLKPEDVQGLGKYEAIVQTPVGRPATIETLPPPKPKGTLQAVKEASRRLYGRAMSEVEAEIKRRREAHKTPKRPRPRVGEGRL